MLDFSHSKSTPTGERKYDLEKQHRKGKLHAIERIRLLLDEDSFTEIGSSVTHDCRHFGMDERVTPYDGVITGFGTVNDRKVCIFSQDFTIMGGSLGKEHGRKIANIIKLAIKSKCPVIGIKDSGGARIQEGVHSLAGYGEIFYYNTLASGYIPQISIIAGPCAGGAVYSPGLTDFVFTIDGISNMYVTGPKVLKNVSSEVVTHEQLGGALVHSTQSGVSHFRCSSERECYTKVRELLSIIPHHNTEKTRPMEVSLKDTDSPKLSTILPEQTNYTYDMKRILYALFDQNSILEVQEEFARNIVVGFARLSGILVGFVANQPAHLAGTIDCDASDKAARFIRYCDAFEIPLVTIVDVPGFLPGIKQEMSGIIRHGAKLLYAYSEATVPKITVIVRKAYGGAYIAMCSKHLGADFVYAWPSAEIAVMGAEAAVDVLFGREIAASVDGDALRNRKIREYAEEFINADIAAQYGYVDEVIDPDETTERVFESLVMLKDKVEPLTVDKKHGNIPL